MKNILKAAATLSLCVPTIFQAFEPKPSFLTLRHIEAGGIGYEEGYTTLHGVWLQNPQNRSFVQLVDLRGHIFNNGKWAANAGWGFRKTTRTDRIWGLNAFYDYRNTNHLNYNQVSFGAETLGKLIDFRINGYVPVGKTITKGYQNKFGYFKNNSLYLSQKKEFGLYGANAEMGLNFGNCNFWRYYVALGPYYYHGQIGDDAWGGKVRFKVSFKQYFAIEISNSYDNLFHNRFQGQIYFTIPIGKKIKEDRSKKLKLKSFNCRVADPIERNEIIVVNRKHKYPLAIDPKTGAPYSFLFVNNTSASNGTFESPYHSLTQAQNNSVPGQIIYLYPGDGTTKDLNQGIVLKDNQKFWGASKPYFVETQIGIIQIPSQSLSRPKITSPSGIPAITLAKNNQVSDLIIVSVPETAIYGVNPNYFSLTNCQLDQCVTTTSSGAYPVYINSSSPLEVSFINNQLTSNLNTGIAIEFLSGMTNATVTFLNNVAVQNKATTGFSSVLFLNPAQAVGTCVLRAENNTFQGNSVVGFNVQSSASGSFSYFEGIFSNNIIQNNKAGAIALRPNGINASVSIINNQITQNDGRPIQLDSPLKLDNLYALISDNNLSQSGNLAEGCYVSGAGIQATITLINNQITSNASSGFAFYNGSTGVANLNIDIQNNLIQDNKNGSSNSGGGISIEGFNKLNLAINGNTLTNNIDGNKVGYFYTSTNKPANTVVTFTNNILTSGDSLFLDYSGSTPSQSCLQINNNTATSDPSFTYNQRASGTCFIAPLNYTATNSGTFVFFGTITPRNNCSGVGCSLKEVPIKESEKDNFFLRMSSKN